MNNKFKLNKQTLTFFDKNLEQEFREYTISKLDYSSRLALVVGGIIYLAFIPIDAFENGVNFNALFYNRIILVSLVFFVLWISFIKGFKKYYFLITIGLFFVVGLGVLHAIVEDPEYLSALSLIIMFFTLIPFLTFSMVLIINLIFFVLYIICLFFFLDLETSIIIKQIGMHFSVAFISVTVFYIKQNLERLNYVKGKRNKAINVVVNNQLKELELTHKNIIDSITYAKRIQDALLPSDLKIKVLPIDLEIYYKPKDTIGGDFYWVEDLGENVVVVIGDCTGHGVPGALMTSLGINGLINSVTEQRMVDPSQILTYLDDYVYNLLSETDENRVKDGMEIGVVTINKSKGTLSFASAGRPLIYVDNNEVHRVKAFKRDIGSKLIKTPYHTEILPVSNTATYYLFSDGMTDQFGGKRNKRLGSKAFNNFLLNLEELPLDKQKEELEKYYKEYMGSTKQTDDMIWGALKIKK